MPVPPPGFVAGGRIRCADVIRDAQIQLPERIPAHAYVVCIVGEVASERRGFFKIDAVLGLHDAHIGIVIPSV